MEKKKERVWKGWQKKRLLIHELNPHKAPKTTARLQEKLWPILTLHSHWQLQTEAPQLQEPGFISATPHKVAYFAPCLAGFTVTWSTCDAERWPGSHESTASLSTSSMVTRWTDFHPSDLNEPPGNLNLNHRCLLFTLAGKAALMMYGPTAVAEI